MLKNHLPGPYTFILPASKQVPKILKSKKDTIGLRVPDNIICQAILETWKPHTEYHIARRNGGGIYRS